MPIVAEASNIIVKVYGSSFTVHNKSDGSPVSDADLKANAIILSGLSLLTPDIPVVSEESGVLEYAQRRLWKRYWLVDPLDGTREFIQGCDQFTVNIALIENQQAVLGVVALPVSKLVYTGVVAERKAEKFYFSDAPEAQGIGDRCRITTRTLDEKKVLLLTSRSRTDELRHKFFAELQQTFPNLQQQPVGSSLKLCLLAEGLADLYPKLGPTSEWDTAAGQAVLEAAGGAIWSGDQKPMRYNRKESLINPHFLAVSDSGYDWWNKISTKHFK